MLILDVTCSNPGIIQIAKILKTVFQMIQIIGPILAMVSLGILFFRLMVFDYDERTNVNATKKYINLKGQIKNALLALVITFFLPIFVNLVMSATFMKGTFQISACWKEVDSYKAGKSTYISKKKDKNKETGTFIIDPNKYKGTDGDPNADVRGNNNSINSVNSTSLSKAFVDLAVAQLNDPSHKGGEKYWRFAGAKSHMAWCSEFVTWNVFHAEYNGTKLSSILSKKCIASKCWADFCKQNSKTTFHNASSNYAPKEGDLIFFSYEPKGISHIGIVRYSDKNRVYTIEGNVSDYVRKRTIMLSDKHLVGYCSWY